MWFQVCRKFSLEHFSNIKNIVPILSNSNQCKIQGCLILHDQSNIPEKMRELNRFGVRNLVYQFEWKK